MSLLFFFRSRHGIPAEQVLPKPQGVSTPAGIVVAPQKKKRRVLYRPKPISPVPVRQLELSKKTRKPEVELIREKEPQRTAPVVFGKLVPFPSLPIIVPTTIEVNLRQFVSDTMKSKQREDLIFVKDLVILRKLKRLESGEDEIITMMIAANT